MPFYWKKDIREQAADTLLLLEDCHYHWLLQDEPRRDLALILKAYPHIAWYITHKIPELKDRVTLFLRTVENESLPSDMDALLGDFMESIEDWIIYVTTPEDYHRQPFNGWDEKELTELTDYRGKTVIDIGSGTGKQAFAVAPLAKTVWCVEPVWNLRRSLKKRAEDEGRDNIFVVDGMLPQLPFPTDFADVTTSGHVIGDDIVREVAETERITKSGGTVIFCHGNIDADNATHRFLMEAGYNWSSFLEPGDSFGGGMKRKYWKIMP